MEFTRVFNIESYTIRVDLNESENVDSIQYFLFVLSKIIELKINLCLFYHVILKEHFPHLLVLSCPRQRNQRRPVPVPVTGVRYNSLLWMCTLNTLTWPAGVIISLEQSKRVWYWCILVTVVFCLGYNCVYIKVFFDRLDFRIGTNLPTKWYTYRIQLSLIRQLCTYENIHVQKYY